MHSIRDACRWHVARAQLRAPRRSRSCPNVDRWIPHTRRQATSPELLAEHLFCSPSPAVGNRDAARNLESAICVDLGSGSTLGVLSKGSYSRCMGVKKVSVLWDVFRASSQARRPSSSALLRSPSAGVGALGWRSIACRLCTHDRRRRIPLRLRRGQAVQRGARAAAARAPAPDRRAAALVNRARPSACARRRPTPPAPAPRGAVREPGARRSFALRLGDESLSPHSLKPCGKREDLAEVHADARLSRAAPLALGPRRANRFRRALLRRDRPARLDRAVRSACSDYLLPPPPSRAHPLRPSTGSPIMTRLDRRQPSRSASSKKKVLSGRDRRLHRLVHARTGAVRLTEVSLTMACERCSISSLAARPASPDPQVGGGHGTLTWPLADALRGADVSTRFNPVGRSFPCAPRPRPSGRALALEDGPGFDSEHPPEEHGVYERYDIILGLNPCMYASISCRARAFARPADPGRPR